ncbi:hypothetical protein ASPACDRAFT_61859 [Aspergillus aculeatus ATCC 16872]|uniref:Carbohydrate-binding module family 96 domain-containing protein n=1 Tax=Aspergillus aculeatus (strain ATCC 16872 / CBS 172.66 / WB 5094) TaxID=690307 RepID=A0A1L9WQC4_ASPA1|nr:uncharacterized protein ASPACDRAFT_61859 [Aspergillus aculeatus ATCC 16872]OJJ98340.1 hypothetical protein ASPACDRAFT_61859 [Aspergillus aculeatus ATCC 16872]
MAHLPAATVFLTALLSGSAYAATAYIDPDLTPSFPPRGSGFLVQLRIAEMKSIWNMTDAQISPFFQRVANDGLTVVNSQITWWDIQPDTYYNATESTYIRGGSYATTNYADEASHEIGYDASDASQQELTYLKFDFTAYTLGQIDAAKGMNDTDYWSTARSPSWDPINEASYYDFDASPGDSVSNGTVTYTSTSTGLTLPVLQDQLVHFETKTAFTLP